MTAKGQNPSTGTVHYAKADGADLIQSCGNRADQISYLDPTDAEVTCRRCTARAPKAPARVAAAAPRTYGRQEWTLGQLREGAKLAGLKGYTRLDGDALLAALVGVQPVWA